MSTSQKCWSCNRSLDSITDRQKSTGKYWKNCQRCRDERTSVSRRKRGLSPVQRSEIPIDHDARPKQKTKWPVPRRHVLIGTLDPVETRSPRVKTYLWGARPNSTPYTYQPPSKVKSTNLGGLNTTPKLPTTLPSSFTRAIQCSVCSEEHDSGDVPRLENCLHEPRVCQGCFANWLTSQVGNTSWDRIVCPSDGCGVLVSHEEMKRLASDDTYTRYDELSTRNVLSSIPNFRHCLRSGCNSGQIHDNENEGNIFRCVACSFLVCTTLDEAFHVGETCEAYNKRKGSERKVENDASAEKIQDTTKQCPGEGCGVRIEKNNGCDHMTCKFENIFQVQVQVLNKKPGRRCKHEFCWQCSAPYKGARGIYTVNNSMHERTCRYHAAVPAVMPTPTPVVREPSPLEEV
jgi:hypothetical protein